MSIIFLYSSNQMILNGYTKKRTIISTLKLYANKANLQPQHIKKLTFSDVYSNFESFLPFIYKFGKVYTLVYRCFRICSNLAQFHTKLSFLKEIFRKNGHPENFIDKYFKKFLSIFVKKSTNGGKKAFSPSPSILRTNIFANSD